MDSQEKQQIYGQTCLVYHAKHQHVVTICLQHSTIIML